MGVMKATVCYLLRVVRTVLRRFVAEDYDQLSASLAYQTLFSLVPLVAVTFGVLSAIPGFESYMADADRFVARSLLPERSGAQIVEYILSFSRNAVSMTALGALGLVVTILFLVTSVERALNEIWCVSVPSKWWRPLGLCLVALSLWPLVILALVTLVYEAVSLSIHLVRPEGGGGLALRAGGLLVAALCFAAVYGFVPNTPVRMRDALAGGVSAAFGFFLLQKGFAFYVGSMPSLFVLYGAFAIVPVFLLWLYLSWAIILLGGLVAATLPVCSRN